MDIDSMIENMTLRDIDKLEDITELLDTYRRHILDGFHEALTYRLDEIFADTVSANLKPLLRTFRHLLNDDPKADDEAYAAYGTMLAQANMDASLGMNAALGETDMLSEILTATIKNTVDRYETAVFEDDDDDEYDEFPD